MKKNARRKEWVPEIFYDDSEGPTIPYIQVPKEEEMPKMLFIFESRETGEVEPGQNGEEFPVVQLDLHQYVDMNSLKLGLSEDEYDNVRKAIGLLPLKEATQKGQKITENVRQNLEK